MADVVANGVRHHVQRLGRGDRTVVFVHGLVMDNLSSFYFTLANPVAAGAEVILYDLRGHGMSERPAGGYAIPDLVADLRALLDELGVARPVELVGNSFGGLIALAFAAAHPDRVAKLALIDAHDGTGDWAAQMTATLGLTGEARDAQIGRSFQSWLGRHSDRKRTRLARAAEALVEGTSLIEDLRASPPVTEAALAQIRCPVLALYGELSDVLDRGKQLASLLPACTLHVLPGCTHSVLWEATAEVRERIVGFGSAGSGAPAARRPTGHRFLFVVPPLTGHVNPTISVARALEARGHEVAWVAHPGKVRPLLPPGARLFPLPEVVSPELATTVADRARAVRGATALKFLWEDFLLPLARQMRPGIEAAIAELRPSVVCVDQQAVAGGLAARRARLPWATLATTSAGVTDPLGALPQVKRWLGDHIAQLEREADLPPADAGELSPHLVLAFTTSALVGLLERFPAHYRFVGPSISDRPEATPFPWERLRRPCVLVSMGTVNAEASGRFYEVAIAALRDLPMQVVLVAPPELVPDVPENFLVARYVPQLALLPRVDAVVCHGGHNTVCEALANGLPLVIAPIKDDQPIVADQVVASGAGLRVKFGRVQPAELRDAVVRVTSEPAFREAAARVRESFEGAGGADAAALALEGLV